MDKRSTSERAHGISLLIPTQNAELTVELCIRSFVHYPDEIIVVDNGSTDGTKEIVKELEKEFDHLSFYDCPELPDLHHNRQFALEKSRFNWIARLDSDYVAYTSGDNDIRDLRKLVLAAPRTEPPSTFRIKQFSLTRDCNTVGIERSEKPEGRGKYVQGGWSELGARIIQYFSGMSFARVNKRWEGVPGQETFLSRTLDRAYWMHCDFKRPVDYLLRSERTNWREHGDFDRYPTLREYLRAVLPEKYGTECLKKAALMYMKQEFDPWVRPYDPATMPPYPETVELAAKGQLQLFSGSIVSRILPNQPRSTAHQPTAIREKNDV
ncbi:Glycosyl transferase family 2 [Paucidesulfovibrio gracilis DSM 16080]|uniref:Glycosyl transferase family 2 n=1 Tax=Paucidesulfovibrio gracilis DSM 16080 TaxID=1121449 RepID=A0A1T4W9N8_9BACT|nr:glycosyltransferase [Paucidesulfovibrio gracilis]SKA73907.1 Glycosyl transferase family 2 [Paucidesulfovibrio gracilis DSM 16080]